jgi:type IV pilus assembly protein PilX
MTGPRDAQGGFVLVISLLLLVVVTLLGIGMYRSFGLQGEIAGNLREKGRALQAAESAQQYAEAWLASGANATTGTACGAPVLSANAGLGQVCSNILTTSVDGGSVANVPWTIGGAAVGVTYMPPCMVVQASNGTTTTAACSSALSSSNGIGYGMGGTYYAAPVFYISYLGASKDGTGNAYQIDAVGYGTNASSVAVVESTYVVGSSEAKGLSGP